MGVILFFFCLFLFIARPATEFDRWAFRKVLPWAIAIGILYAILFND